MSPIVRRFIGSSRKFDQEVSEEPENKNPSDDLEYDCDIDEYLSDQLDLLNLSKIGRHDLSETEEIRNTPLFSSSVKNTASQQLAGPSVFPQLGLFAGRIDRFQQVFSCEHGPKFGRDQDPRIFLNVNAPWSAFICGSQGSGKSHSLSCMLENCLLSDPRLGSLPKPLTALVFHYDPFTSAVGGQPCEAAYLCSSGIEVKVLVSPSNLRRMNSLYTNIGGESAGALRPKVEPLILDQKYLNTERLLSLMAAETTEGSVPLYMQAVIQVLRKLARDPQSRQGINYAAFKTEILSKNLTPNQSSPLQLRLDLLESFIAVPKAWDEARSSKGNDWTPSAGRLTIVDLSCPFIDTDTACSLFDICVGIFLEQSMEIGRIIALDEAHKFMKDSTAASKLTNSLLAAVRLQRHLACRIVIATQEPTISPRLLDLCTITLVHRFSSPDWLHTLKHHLAAAAAKDDRSLGAEDGIFAQITRLSVGEALLFAPSAILDVEERMDQEGKTQWRAKKLGLEHLNVRVRGRLTADGGRSRLAV